MIETSVLPYASRANFANTDEWGFGLVYASPSDKVYTLTSPTWYDSGPVSFRIPTGAKPSTGSDHHLVVVDGDRALSMWDAHYNASSDTWWAGSRFIENMEGWGANGAPGTKAGSAVAAGFSGMGGVIRPEEIAQGRIDHALSVMVPVTRKGYIAAPATGTDGQYDDPNAIPEGARIQLDPNFNVDAQNWPAWEKAIAKALQTYGAFVSDKGGSIAIYGQTDMNTGNMTWSQAGAPEGASLSNLPWSSFRVIDLPNPSTGAAIAWPPSEWGTAPTTGPVPMEPTPPAEPPPPSPDHAELAVGSGPDELVLRITEKAYQGSAQFAVSMDGTQIGGIMTAVADRGSGVVDLVKIRGDWAQGQHTATVTFLNDAWGGTDATDRNLYVESATYNGANVAGAARSLLNNGPSSFTVDDATGLPAGTTLTGTSGRDKLVGTAGGDTIKGLDSADRIEGRAGNDQLHGGAGRDVFAFSRGDGKDVVHDFQRGQDRLEFGGDLVQSDVRWTAKTVDGTAGVAVTYGSAGEGIWLPKVSALSASDFVFA